MDLSATKTAVHGTFQNLVNAVKPIPTVSTFLQEGDLTPDEVRTPRAVNAAKAPRSSSRQETCSCPSVRLGRGSLATRAGP